MTFRLFQPLLAETINQPLTKSINKMSKKKARVYLTYPEKLIKEPVVYELGHKFKVVTNIRSASVSAGVGLVALEIDGDAEEVEKSLKYLKDLGISVKPLNQDVIYG